MSLIGISIAIEKILNPVNTSFAGARRAPENAAKIGLRKIDEIENALFIQLVRIIELSRDDPDTVGKCVNILVHESLIVETHLAAAGVAGIIALEVAPARIPAGRFVGHDCSEEQADLRPGRPLRCQRLSLSPKSFPNTSVPSEGTMRVTVIVSVPPVSCQSNSLPPPSGSPGVGAASG